MFILASFQWITTNYLSIIISKTNRNFYSFTINYILSQNGNKSGYCFWIKKSYYLQRTLQKIQQGELFNYMTERGLKGFQSGKYGSTALHLTSLQYQIKQDCPDLFIGVDLAIIHKWSIAWKSGFLYWISII